MKSIELDQRQPDLAKLAEEVCGDNPIVLTRNGEAVAAIVPVDDLEVENWKLSHSATFAAILDRSRKGAQESDTLSHQEVLDLFDADRAR
ncbi:MAG: type II toxin-antitoxin system Phd/YefM family antitoxin [Bryobacterales bacterium]|nr:type II toxin-antitoxin system Phd/YefM family antitoxin [Bryobacterales bacterium]